MNDRTPVARILATVGTVFAGAGPAPAFNVKPQQENTMAIYTHVAVGTNNIDAARDFYDAVLAPLGIKRLGVSISFAAPSRAAVDEFHKRALESGGQCAGAPGPRPVAPTAYAAYIRDLDGNKLATYCFADA